MMNMYYYILGWYNYDDYDPYNYCNSFDDYDDTYKYKDYDDDDDDDNDFGQASYKNNDKHAQSNRNDCECPILRYLRCAIQDIGVVTEAISRKPLKSG